MQPSTIVWAENDIDDIEFIKAALARAHWAKAVHWCANGKEVMDYLNTCCTADQALPALVVLDVNMELINGVEVLTAIRQQMALEHLPVCIFTTAAGKPIRMVCESWGAPVFEKPDDFAAYATVVQNILSQISAASQQTPA